MSTLGTMLFGLIFTTMWAFNECEDMCRRNASKTHFWDKDHIGKDTCCANKALEKKGQNIKHLRPEKFSNYYSIDLSINKIEELPQEIFADLRCLEYLNLSYNKIRKLPSRFINLTALSTLDLSYNKIKMLPSAIFTDLPALSTLSLSFNLIEEIPLGTFTNLFRLEFLSLSNNSIKKLHSTTFKNLSSLNILDLSNNEIDNLPPEIFSNLSNLEWLDISTNKIKELPWGVFSNLSGLKRFLLRDNNLTRIPDEAFRKLNALKLLILSDNPVMEIGSKAFIVPTGNLSIYLLRLPLSTLSLKSFDDITDLNASVTVEEGYMGVLKLTNATRNCTVHVGSEHDEPLYVDENKMSPFVVHTLLLALRRAGFANYSAGFNKLLPCRRGTFVDISAKDYDLKCTECPSGGYYQATKAYANFTCTPCERGTYVTYNKAPGDRREDCLACPRGTNSDGFAGLRACTCLKDFYRMDMFDDCLPCKDKLQDGLECVGDLINLQKDYWWYWRNQTHGKWYGNFTENLRNFSFAPELHKPNYYVLNFSYDIPKPHSCPGVGICHGGALSTCKAGHKGPLCEICRDGYYKQLKKCRLCPKKGLMVGQLAILGAIVILLVVIAVWRSKKKSKNGTGRSFVDLVLGRLKIVIGFYQVTFGIMEAFSDISWPDSLSVIGKYTEIAQVNLLQIAPLHCILPRLKFDAFGSLIAMMSLNGAAVIIALVSFILATMISTRNMSNGEEKKKKTVHIKELVKRNLFFFLYVTYLNTCLKTAQVLPLTCHKICIDDIDEKNGTCKEYLRADYTVRCDRDEYKRLVVLGYCSILYVIVMPAAAFIPIWKRHRGVRKTKDKPANNSNDFQDQDIGLGFLHENYNPPFWYWELVETVRKLLLTSGLMLADGKNSRAFLGLALLMSSLYSTKFTLAQPMIDIFENKLMMICLAVTLSNLAIGGMSAFPREGIKSSISAIQDKPLFNILVFGANSLVIVLLAAQYVDYMFCYVRKWSRNPKWSLSCCLSLLLPIDDLQGEKYELTWRSILKKKLKTGAIEMSSIADTLKYTRADDMAVDQAAETTTLMNMEQGVLQLSQIDIHELRGRTGYSRLLSD